MKTTDIHLILTGGTIEKTYDPRTEKPEFLHPSLIPDYLRTKIKAYTNLRIEEFSQIDSAHMNAAIRNKLLQVIHRSASDKILIVHGTSTLVETARYLSQNLEKGSKTVMITGAMIPLGEFALSDGGFNLGYALAKLEEGAAGVYVAMNAKLFAPENVVKNTDIGRFETVE